MSQSKRQRFVAYRSISDEFEIRFYVRFPRDRMRSAALSTVLASRPTFSLILKSLSTSSNNDNIITGTLKSMLATLKPSYRDSSLPGIDVRQKRVGEPSAFFCCCLPALPPWRLLDSIPTFCLVDAHLPQRSTSPTNRRHTTEVNCNVKTVQPTLQSRGAYHSPQGYGDARHGRISEPRGGGNLYLSSL